MFGRLDDKVAIVTGAGQGIGEGIAKVFAQADAKVVVASRSVENSEQTVAEIKDAGNEAIFIQTDCGDRESIRNLVNATVDHYGRLDICVHNAAVFTKFPAEEFPDDELDKALDVNFKPCMWLTQDAVKHMRKQGGGRFVFTSSVTGPRVAMPLTSAYVAAKGAMNAYIKTASLEFARENITFNCVEPGYILTEAMANLADEDAQKEMASYIPKGAFGTPEDIAYCMLYLASDEAAYVTAQTIAVDGGSCVPESPVQVREFYEKKGQTL